MGQPAAPLICNGGRRGFPYRRGACPTRRVSPPGREVTQVGPHPPAHADGATKGLDGPDPEAHNHAMRQLVPQWSPEPEIARSRPPTRQRKKPTVAGFLPGAGEAIRTPDLLITSEYIG